MDIGKLTPTRIMLVEDSEGDVFIFRRAMREARLLNEVVVFDDGKDALDWITGDRTDEELPGIIFLDINMPRLSGFEVLKKLKQADRVRGIPVVMLTISQEEEDIVRSYDYGAVSFISKSVRAENLLDILTAAPGIRFMAYKVVEDPSN